MKAKIDGQMIEEMNFWYFKQDLAKNAKRAGEKERVAELVAQGIDKQLAKDMVRFGLA